MTIKVHFTGPLGYRLRSAAELSNAIAAVTTRRSLKGRRRPGWNWFMEVGRQFLKRQLKAAFQMRDARQARRYLDSIVISSPGPALNIRPVTHQKFRGNWFCGGPVEAGVTLLYFHGGGYSFYPRAYTTFITQLTLAAKSRTFALDYSLSPEYRFPVQLEESMDAYRWLLNSGIDPDNLVLLGDSAGGNLALAMLLTARDARLPMPALAVLLSPATDFETNYTSMVTNEDSDWIDQNMLARWANSFCDASQHADPLVSPIRADLRGLPPIYMQAGKAEILYDSIHAFADQALAQGADLVLESWDDMNHVFQIFAPDVPQSVEALHRIGQVIDARVRNHEAAEAVLSS